MRPAGDRPPESEAEPGTEERMRRAVDEFAYDDVGVGWHPVLGHHACDLLARHGGARASLSRLA